jgi:hypothetical protein
VDYLRTIRKGLNLTNLRPWKILSKKQDIVMNKLDIEQNLAKAGGRRIVRDSRKRGLNPQDLRTIKRTQG